MECFSAIVSSYYAGVHIGKELEAHMIRDSVYYIICYNELGLVTAQNL